MDISEATLIVEKIRNKREQYGRNLYDPGKDSEYHAVQILDAYEALIDDLDERAGGVNDALVKARRETNAAKARETRAQNKNNELRAKIENLESTIKTLKDGLQNG